MLSYHKPHYLLGVVALCRHNDTQDVILVAELCYYISGNAISQTLPWLYYIVCWYSYRFGARGNSLNFNITNPNTIACVWNWYTNREPASILHMYFTAKFVLEWEEICGQGLIQLAECVKNSVSVARLQVKIRIWQHGSLLLVLLSHRLQQSLQADHMRRQQQQQQFLRQQVLMYMKLSTGAILFTY